MKIGEAQARFSAMAKQLSPEVEVLPEGFKHPLIQGGLGGLGELRPQQNNPLRCGRAQEAADLCRQRSPDRQSRSSCPELVLSCWPSCTPALRTFESCRSLGYQPCKQKNPSCA